MTGSGTLRETLGGEVYVGADDEVTLGAATLASTSLVTVDGGVLTWTATNNHSNAGSVVLQNGGTTSYENTTGEYDRTLTNTGQITIGEGCEFTVRGKGWVGYPTNDYFYNYVDSTVGTIAVGGILDQNPYSVINGNLVIGANASWEIASNTSVNAAYVVNDGAITVPSGVTWTFGGSLTGSGTFEVAGSVGITDITEFGQNVTLSGGTLDGNTAGFRTIAGAQVTGEGTVRETVGGFVVVDGQGREITCTSINLQSTGLMQAVNNGTLRFSNAFTNQGYITAYDEGIVQIENGGTNESIIDAEYGGVLKMERSSGTGVLANELGALRVFDGATCTVKNHRIDGSLLIYGGECEMQTNSTVNGDVVNHGTLTAAAGGSFDLNGELRGTGTTIVNASCDMDSVNIELGQASRLQVNHTLDLFGNLSHTLDDPGDFTFGGSGQLYFKRPGSDPVTIEYELACLDLGDDPINHVGNPAGYVDNFQVRSMRVQNSVTLSG